MSTHNMFFMEKQTTKHSALAPDKREIYFQVNIFSYFSMKTYAVGTH